MNSAYLLGPNGALQGRYDKVHLVPYGEYVPLRRFFPFITKLVAGIGDFKKGKGYYPLHNGNYRLGVLICYEFFRRLQGNINGGTPNFSSILPMMHGLGGPRHRISIFP